jgi:hypothetical protein
MSQMPTEPSYYWAKLKTPSGGILYHQDVPGGVKLTPETDDDGKSSWCSGGWEIVEVNENDPFGDIDDPEHFSVQVFGIPITQWPLDFFWGPKINIEKPA